MSLVSAGDNDVGDNIRHQHHCNRFRDIYPLKVSILETVPNWIVGEIILIDDASDDRNMLLELDQIDVSKQG